MTSSITVEPYETVEFPDSDTDSWQVVDPFDSDNDDVITTESDVVSSSSDEEGEDVDDEEDEDVDIDDVIASESDVISSDEDEEEEDEDEDDVITSEEEEEEEEENDVITSEEDVDEITNHTQELNKGYELDRLINGEGGAPYNVEISDVMKEDAYFEHMQLQQRMLDEDDVEEQEEEDQDEDEDEYDEDLDDELVPRWLNNKFERQRMRKLGKKVYPKMKKSKRMVNQYNRPGCAGAKHGLGLNNNLVW